MLERNRRPDRGTFGDLHDRDAVLRDLEAERLHEVPGRRENAEHPAASQPEDLDHDPDHVGAREIELDRRPHRGTLRDLLRAPLGHALDLITAFVPSHSSLRPRIALPLPGC